jgi:F0F1-type ATP synthase assembly protein I
MKIANWNDLMEPAAQKAAGEALKDGKTVAVNQAAGPQPHLDLSFLRSPEVSAILEKWKSPEVPSAAVKLSATAQTALANAGIGWTREQRLAIGLGSGAMVGLGVGMIVDLVRTAAPKTSALLLPLATMLIGGGTGAALASGVVSSVEVEYDLKSGAWKFKASGQKLG